MKGIILATKLPRQFTGHVSRTVIKEKTNVCKARYKTIHSFKPLVEEAVTVVID